MRRFPWGPVSVASTAALLVMSGCGDESPSHTPESRASEWHEADIPARYRPFADALEAERQALGIPGVAVALLEHRELAFAHGFGTKGIESDEPVDARTLFLTAPWAKC